MRLDQTTTSKILRGAIVPIVFCTFIGLIIGVITHGDNLEFGFTDNIIKWILSVNAGAIAHQIGWFLNHAVFKWKSSSTIRGIWKPTTFGVLLTFVFILLINEKTYASPEAVLLTFFQVISISIIVHVFLFQFKFYKFLDDPVDSNKDSDGTGESPIGRNDFLLLNINEQIEKVNIQLVSHIKVEDHYCTIVYKKDNEWQNWTVYEKLKNYEEKFPTVLFRINRSVLVNPAMVKKVKKSGGNHLITMKGEPESSFSLSPSQKFLLDQLLPIIS